MSPAVWEVSLGHAKGTAMFPYASPAIFSMTAAFLVIYLVSKMDSSAQAAKERGAFKAQQVRAETGFGSSKSSGH